MRLALQRHPDTPCAAVTAIGVEVERRGGALVLRFQAMGAIGELVLPPAAAPGRADGLWRHTCFEAFVRAPGGEAYYELNFAPSTQWAAYRLAGYREGMSPADVGDPRIRLRSDAGALELTAAPALDRLQLPLDGAWRLGLAAVIEEAGGRRSYWALAHPPGPPDFHHADCFAGELPAPGRP